MRINTVLLLGLGSVAVSAPASARAATSPKGRDLISDLLGDVLNDIQAAIALGNSNAVVSALESATPTATPTGTSAGSAALQSIVQTGKPANLFEYGAMLATNGLLANSVSSLASSFLGEFSAENSETNNNPPPPSTIYPKKLSCDAPYSISEASLRSAIYIPSTFTHGQKPPVILFPGTGNHGYETFSANFIKLLTGSSWADPVWVNVPDRLLDDAQKNAEYAAYALNYIASVTGRNTTIVTWSQGNIDVQVRRQRLFKRQAPAKAVDANVQKGLDIAKSLDIKDPIFNEQWHLYNPVQLGHDLNVTGLWQAGITGLNSTTCFIDDGLDFTSEDLKDNYFAEGSWDYNDPGPDPMPRLSDDKHGTRCAGEVAAGRNNACGVGVAYDSRVSGVRILSNIISDADEAAALNKAYQQNQIYSCSWGPPDDGRSMEAPNTLIKRAMLNGIQKGRGALGSLFVFAIGNGASNDDDCNFDGYTNSIYSVSVGGIDREGLHPYYSEKCSAQLVVTYSSGSGDAIHTTDTGTNACYDRHGGTSAAGPLVAGVYALVLQVRPDLHWRDIQYITMMTAVPVNEDTGDYQTTAIGRRFSHQYGYGKMDAWATVEYAKTWKSVKAQAWYWSPWMHVRQAIPQGQHGLVSTFEVTKDMLEKANLERLEHVTVTMNVEHTRRGDLSAELHSPAGIVSHIATPRRNDAAKAGYKDWTFMSVAHWGETGVGNWTVVVKDTNVNDNEGTFTDWRLRLWGEAIDGEHQELLPMPNADDDADHDADHTTVVASTTSHGQTHPTGEPSGNPDDHIDRPVNSKPGETTATTTSTAATVSTSSTASSSSSMPSSTDKPTEKPEDKESSSKPNFLPSPFPTFGASKKTQVWIYGAIALIVAFCASLGVWYTLTRRRARRNARDEYEFEMLDEEDADDGGARSGLMNGSGGQKKKRRAGELYDAFAEGSDDEDVFSVGDEEEDEDRYRDEERDQHNEKRPEA